MQLTIPNQLTLLRIALIPVFIGVFYIDHPWSHVIATALFGLAAITDWLDGYLARKWGQLSPFGAFLDPVADKLMVAAALVMLVDAHPGPAMAIPAIIIIGREITISALREWMAELGARATVAVSMIGKLKTTAQMASILLLIFEQPLFGIPIFEIGFALLYLAAILTLWSMIVYLIAAWPLLSGEESD
jgi:CDP-diacylglycerol--glycerol-3-phosphate 3-phosphatidyltransferase/cardiolipin synthase